MEKAKNSKGGITWKQDGENLQIKVERGPRGRLMLRYRGDDRDVVLGVRWIQ